MYKHHTKHRGSEYDLQADIDKIKAAFIDAAHDVKGRANEIFTQSVDGVREKSAELEEGATGYIAEQPFKSVGVAFLLGMAMMFLLRK